VAGNTTTHVQLKRGGVFRLRPIDHPRGNTGDTESAYDNAYTRAHREGNAAAAAAASAGATSGGRHGYPQPNWRPRMETMPAAEQTTAITIQTAASSPPSSRSSSSPPRSSPSAVSMDEDEALARAISHSLNDTPSSPSGPSSPSANSTEAVGRETVGGGRRASASTSRSGGRDPDEHADERMTGVSYRDRHRWGRQLQRLDDMVRLRIVLRYMS
jgi:hypothetical protein